LIRVGYLSSSEAYTNNWGLFGKENCLAFDWWKHFLKILRRSEITINLTRPLKKNASKWVLPLLYYIVKNKFRTHLANVGHCWRQFSENRRKSIVFSSRSASNVNIKNMMKIVSYNAFFRLIYLRSTNAVSSITDLSVSGFLHTWCTLR
jgi:hypothetical protein